MSSRATIHFLRGKKEAGEKIAIVTAYDYPTATLAERAGVDAILVGDSLGMVVLGYPTTLPVTMEEMLHHVRAVARGAGNTLIIADMPFMSFQASEDQAVENAGRFLKEAGAHAVKIEGGEPVAPLVRRLVGAGIPVMGHLGMTPQSVNQFGGWRVQGKQPEAARRILDDARLLEAAGVFAIVLEMVPAPLAGSVTAGVAVPTIGIGAGPECDGQVQVLHDLLGLFFGFSPRHAKRYAEVGETIQTALKSYVDEVRAGAFPAEEHSTPAPDPQAGAPPRPVVCKS